MASLTMIGRVVDGLPLAASMPSDEQVLLAIFVFVFLYNTKMYITSCITYIM